MKWISFAPMLVVAVELRKCQITSCLDAREIPADPSVVLQIGELRSAEKAGFLDKGPPRDSKGPSHQTVFFFQNGPSWGSIFCSKNGKKYWYF